jgi:hypothetical protein
LIVEIERIVIMAIYCDIHTEDLGKGWITLGSEGKGGVLLTLQQVICINTAGL